jgi:hypothetical protein
MADPVVHRHPVIGVYKFYENWSTETFKRKSQRVGCLFHLQILSVVKIFALMITTRNEQSQVQCRTKLELALDSPRGAGEADLTPLFQIHF